MPEQVIFSLGTTEVIEKFRPATLWTRFRTNSRTYNPDLPSTLGARRLGASWSYVPIRARSSDVRIQSELVGIFTHFRALNIKKLSIQLIQ